MRRKYYTMRRPPFQGIVGHNNERMFVMRNILKQLTHEKGIYAGHAAGHGRHERGQDNLRRLKPCSDSHITQAVASL